jgi:hypothetical protein
MHQPTALTRVLGEAQSVVMVRHLLSCGAEANPVEDARVPPIYTATGRLGHKPLLPVIQALLDEGANPDAQWTTLRGPTSARSEAKGDILALFEAADRRRLEASMPDAAGERLPVRL